MPTSQSTDTVSEMLAEALGGALALEHHRAGDPAEAERLAREVLRKQPESASAHHVLGLLARDRGDHAAALELFARASQGAPFVAEHHLRLGEAARATGQLARAVAALEQAVELDPESAEAASALGVALVAAGRRPEAIASWRRAIALDPGFARAHNNLGSALLAEGDLEGATACFEHAVGLGPDSHLAHANLGNALRLQGKTAAAAESYRRSLALKPDYPPALNNLGGLLSGGSDLAGSIACFRAAIAVSPDSVEGWSNLGAALREAGRLRESVEAYQRATALQPSAAAHDHLGGAWRELGRVAEALASFRAALAIDPDFAAAHSNLLLTLHYAAAEPAEVAAEHRRFGARFTDPLLPTEAARAVVSAPDRPLRVGYVSGELRAHSVAAFLESAFEHNDRGLCEVIAYSDTPRPDEVTARLRRTAGAWRDLTGMGHEEVAALVRHDAIDVLVDLAGHTARNRLPVFARRPAPVQVTYLGYPDTTGMVAMDHRLTDAEADPEGLTERHHTEHLLRLPGGAWCWRPPEACPEPGPSPVAATGRVTFGSFNGFARISAEAVALWAAVLARVAGSTLLVQARALDDPEARADLLERFVRHGIGVERLALLGWQDDALAHLAGYHRVDLALDAYPYHGAATTCEALWMGVPVVTLAGSTSASRTGVSLLSRVGLRRMIASSADEYVAIAARAAAAVRSPGEPRARLRETMRASPLCDGARLARELAEAFHLAVRDR